MTKPSLKVPRQWRHLLSVSLDYPVNYLAPFWLAIALWPTARFLCLAIGHLTQHRHELMFLPHLEFDATRTVRTYCIHARHLSKAQQCEPYGCTKKRNWFVRCKLSHLVNHNSAIECLKFHCMLIHLLCVSVYTKKFYFLKIWSLNISRFASKMHNLCIEEWWSLLFT